MAAVDNAGIQKLKVLYMVNIKMWHHPKYYKELRKRNKSDQAISKNEDDGQSERASDPGLTETQASSDKRQAPSRKHQAPSRKRQAP